MENKRISPPTKARLDWIVKELGLSDFTPLTQIHTLIDSINDHGLQVKVAAQAFSKVRLQPKADGSEQLFDSYGQPSAVHSLGQTVWASAICSELTLLRVAHVDSVKLLVKEVEVNGEPMYLVDKTDQYIVSHEIHFEHMYMDKVDLEQYNPTSAPPYADPKSEYFAPELALAVQLHEDIMLKKIPQMYLTNMEVKVASMLNTYDKNHDSSAEKISRLATIIGVKKKKAHPK